MTHTDAAATVFNAHAESYDAPRRRLLPCFDRFYETAVAAAGLGPGAPERILDLGAGTGMLSARLRAAYPTAELTLLDIAAQMLQRARGRLGDWGISYLEADLLDPLPSGPWDCIASALAIHHLDDADKRALFARVRAGLTPDGVFVNADQVAGPMPFFERLYATWQERGARRAGTDDAEWRGALERMELDRCADVEIQLAWLHEAGFREVDCLFKDHRFAVLVARR